MRPVPERPAPPARMRGSQLRLRPCARTYRIVIDVSEADGVGEEAPAEVQRHALHVAHRPHSADESRVVGSCVLPEPRSDRRSAARPLTLTSPPSSLSRGEDAGLPSLGAGLLPQRDVSDRAMSQSASSED